MSGPGASTATVTVGTRLWHDGQWFTVIGIEAERPCQRGKALDDARSAFSGVPARKIRGDVDDASVRIVFRDDPLLEGDTEPFERTALDLWGPLLQATQKVSRKDLLA